VLPGHVPTVAQLKPGVLAVHVEQDKNVKKARARRGAAAAARGARSCDWRARAAPPACRGGAGRHALCMPALKLRVVPVHATPRRARLCTLPAR
jgi:hypothetical protein